MVQSPWKAIERFLKKLSIWFSHSRFRYWPKTTHVKIDPFVTLNLYNSLCQLCFNFKKKRIHRVVTMLVFMKLKEQLAKKDLLFIIHGEIALRNAISIQWWQSDLLEFLRYCVSYFRLFFLQTGVPSANLAPIGPSPAHQRLVHLLVPKHWRAWSLGIMDYSRSMMLLRQLLAACYKLVKKD